MNEKKIKSRKKKNTYFISYGIVRDGEYGFGSCFHTINGAMNKKKLNELSEELGKDTVILFFKKV